MIKKSGVNMLRPKIPLYELFILHLQERHGIP